MPPSSTLWPLEDHTVGKHRVLQHYLDAWLPIMMSSNERILFIDAFAGPGEYKRGEKGSPVIALEAFLSHSNRNLMTGDLSFVFIEKDPPRAQHLKRVIDGFQGRLPAQSQVEVFQGTFTNELTNALDAINLQNKTLAPAFVMVDPFGVSDTPMSLIRRILENQKSEVYISFMYEYINRFKRSSEFSDPLDELFGCREWRDGIDEEDPEKRKSFFYGLYKNQLEASGAKYVLHFELYEGKRLKYALFFATNHHRGCDKMKQAMWKVAPFGDFQFRSGLKDQLLLGPGIVDFSPLKDGLLNEFGLDQWVTVEDVEQFLSSDRTEFHTGQYKQVLREMEDKGEINVDQDSRYKKGSFPDGTRLMFVAPPEPASIQSSFAI